MTQFPRRMNDPDNPISQSFVGVDATAGGETVGLGDPAQSRGDTIEVMKTDTSVNTVTVAWNGLALQVLATQGEKVTVFSTGAAWKVSLPPTAAFLRQIIDSFGHQLVLFHPGGPNAVNYIQLSNANSGGPPEIDFRGTDTDVGAVITLQGAGVLDIQGPAKPLTLNGSAPASAPGTAAPSTAALAGATKTWADAITAILQASGILT